MKKRAAIVLGIALVLANRALLRLRLRRRRDGWRRGAGLVLRDGPATFVLSAFNLDVWSDERGSRSGDIAETAAHLQNRLQTRLASHRECFVHVQRTECEDVVKACDTPSYTIGFEGWIHGPERFVRPDAWGDHPYGALLNVVARVSSTGAADLWFRINHVGADGVPMQELISRLEREWGVVGPVFYPTPEEFAPHVRPRSCPSATRNDLCEMQTFIDFAPLLAWRKRMNATLTEPMTVSAALMWCLSSHAKLSHVCIGTTVDVPAMGHLQRCVGVVVMRPSDLATRANALTDYVREFNRQIELTRTRRNSGAKTLDACAHLPPALAGNLLRYALESDPRAFGSMGLTILKDAKVFGAPLGDAGHADGFIAIGSLNLPTSDPNRSVGCVTIKGRRERIECYPTHIRETLLTCDL